MLSVVDQFRRSVRISNGFERSNLLVVVVVEILEGSRIREKVRFELVKLDVRNEPVVTNIFGKGLFKGLNPRSRQ